MRVCASVTFDRHIHQVFAYAAHPQQWPEWMSTVTGVELTSTGPLDVGACFVQTDGRSRGAGRLAWEVTEYEPPRALSCRRIADPGVMIRLVFESVDGSTRLTISAVSQVTGLFADESVLAQTIKSCLMDDLNRLSDMLMERRAPHGSGASLPNETKKGETW